MIIKINLFYDLVPLYVWIKISFCQEANQVPKKESQHILPTGRFLVFT